MSKLYPPYWLEVYDHIQGKWIQCAGTEKSNRPHHADKLLETFNRLVSGAKGGSPNQAPIGYRIVKQWEGCDYVTEVFRWDNGKVA